MPDLEALVAKIVTLSPERLAKVMELVESLGTSGRGSPDELLAAKPTPEGAALSRATEACTCVETETAARSKLTRPHYQIFFEDVAEPTVAEFLESPRDLRKACLAALVLASMADHVHASSPASQERRDIYRRRLAGENADYALVKDVSEAVKHATLRGDGKGISFAQIALRPAVSSGGYGTPWLGYNVAGVYWRPPGVVVAGPDGVEMMLYPSIVGLLIHWRSTVETMRPST